MFATVAIVLACTALVAARFDARAIDGARHFPEHVRPIAAHNGWSARAPASRAARLRFDVALHLRNKRQLADTFWAVSEPSSERYGQHLSIEELAEMTAPHERDVAKVREWIEASGASVVHAPQSRDWLSIEATVEQAEQLFGTDFHEFEHPLVDKPLVRALAPYSVPHELKGHIAFVSGIHTLPKVDPRRAGRAAFSFDKSTQKRQVNNPLIGPAQLRSRYNVTVIGQQAANSMAVAEFQGQYYSPSDLKQFFAQFVKNSNADTVAGVRPPNSNNPNAPGTEASLDIQYIMGVAPNITTYFYASATMDFWSALTTWASLLAGEKDTPLVHSISYGDQGAQSKPSAAYQDRLDLEFKKLGARGISIIFASGDSGAGCDFCIWAEPSFPATCDSVTSVGATRFENGVGSAEMAVEEFGSGGGFSWTVKRPAYQNDAVEHYFKEMGSSLPWQFTYDKNGRGTPDVSALGIGFAVIQSGVETEVGGTSASAPTFAAIVALLNDARLAKGGKPMGFLNPWIYESAAKYPDAFFDVTKGSNTDGCCFTGFDAAPGWDPATGVGTPNFKKLVTLI